MRRTKTRDRIQEYLEQRNVEGEPPTVREIATAVGLKSPSSVQKHLKALEREGIITQGGKGRSRSWRLAGRPLEPSISVVGRVVNGHPIDSEKELEPPLPMPPQAFATDARVVAYRVADDTLRNDGILDGDYVLVARHQATETQDQAPAGVGALLDWQARRRRGSGQPAPPAVSENSTNHGGDATPQSGPVSEPDAPVAVIRLANR